MYNISFKDGVHVTIDDEQNVIVNEYSQADIEFNIIANKAMMGDETNSIRLINAIENRLGEEIF